MSEILIMCVNCGFEDETMSINDESLKMQIIEDKMWDNRDFSNTSLWIRNIYKDIINHECIQKALIIAGIFICPDCGKKQSAINSVIAFIEGN